MHDDNTLTVTTFTNYLFGLLKTKDALPQPPFLALIPPPLSYPSIPILVRSN